MMLRRIAGLASAVLLMRLNVVAVDAMCAQHDVAPAAAAVHGHDYGSASHSTDHSQPTESCERPVVPQCCRAVAPCSVSLDIGTATPDDSVPRHDSERVALGGDLPTSFRPAPDPPPPKA